MLRRKVLIGIGVGLAMGFLFGLAYLLYPLFQEDGYRKSLESGFSAVLGRPVSLEGPIAFTYSLQPQLTLENVRVGNPSSVSQADFFRADRLEIQVSLLPLFQRRLRLEKVLLIGANLLLEEDADGLRNWTVQKAEPSSILSKAIPDFFLDIPETEALAIHDSRIVYRSHLSDVSHEIAIQRASIVAIHDHLRKFAIDGSWDGVPMVLDLQGGRLVDVVDLKEAWPIDGRLSMNGITVVVKGSLRGTHPDEIFSLHVQINGNRLSALNDILKGNLPDSAPFMVAVDVAQKRQAIDLNNILVKLGSSDIAGNLTLQGWDDRPTLVGTLTASRIQVHDLRLSPKGISQEAVRQPITLPTSELLFPVDADVDVTVHEWHLGNIEFGSSAFTARIREKRIQVSSLRAKSFGGKLKGDLDIDLKHAEPQTKLAANFTSFNFGQALQAFKMTEGLTGTTDLDLRVLGNGANVRDFLKGLTLKIRINRSTWSHSDSIPNHRQLAVLQGSLSTEKGGPMVLAAKGALDKTAFGATLVGPSPFRFLTQEKDWPVSLNAKLGDAKLTAKGSIKTAFPEIDWTFAVSLKGKRLSDLGDAFPPVGPYGIIAQVTKDGPRYSVDSLQSRFGTSDLSGTLAVDTGKHTPQLILDLTSNLINFKELSRPGDSAIPREVLGAINGNLMLGIQRSKIGVLELRGLVVNANLQDGHLNVKDLHGTVLNQTSAYGDFQGTFQLDATRAFPDISGNLALKDIRYEHVLPDVQFVNLQEHVMNLNVRFSGAGTTWSNILNESTLMLEGENLQVQFIRQADQSTPVQLNSDILVESVKGGPLRLYAEGNFDATSFRVRSLMGPMKDLLHKTGSWPVKARVDVPHAMIELNGHVHLPFPYTEFALQLLVNADNLRDLQFLATSDLPDVHSLQPLQLAGLVTKSPAGYRVTNLEGSVGQTAIGGHLSVTTDGIRPRLMGALNADRIVLNTLKPPVEDSSAEKPTSMLETMTAPVIGLGSIAVDAVKKKIEKRKPDHDAEARILPNWSFPVDGLKAVDLSIVSEIKVLRTETHDIGFLNFRTTLEDGLLNIQPLTGRLWNGEVDGSLALDVKSYVPTLEMTLNLRDADYGRLMAMFGQIDIIQGRAQSIMLDLKGRGDNVNEVLSRAKGKFEWVNGPLELSTKYLDLWAADFITTALSMALKPKAVSELNCAVGYFDIEEGQMNTETILIDSPRLTIAGVGTLHFASEMMDVILTPRPKDPSLLSLAHTVRITGPLSNPDVTRDKFRVAESEGWTLLGLTAPIDWALAIPQISGTTMGTMNQNPCLEALKGQAHTAQALDDVKGGWWGKIKKTFSNLLGSSAASPEKPE